MADATEKGSGYGDRDWTETANDRIAKVRERANTVSDQALRRMISGALLPIEERLEFMRNGGTSVTLNRGEDNGLWECSWITSGRRYTDFSKDAKIAVDKCINKALAATI